MAKKKAGVNKSQAIRDYLKKKPGATAKEIVPALADEGIKVSEGLVSNVKYNVAQGPGRKKTVKRKKRKKGRPGRRPGRRPGAGQLTANQLLEAKRFVQDAGGIREARKALDTLEKLQ